jgi:hypothetical protein
MFQLQPQLARKPHIVRVEQRDVVPARAPHALVPRDCGAGIALPHQCDGVAVACDDVAGLIGGSVVDDEHLQSAMALSEHAVEGVADEVRAVVRRDDERDERGAHGGHVRRGWPEPRRAS